jgi:hypothetical protein
MIVRVSNPTATAAEARLTLGLPFERAEARRLDESAFENHDIAPRDGAFDERAGSADESFVIRREGRTLRFRVPARALRTVGVL